MSDYNFNTKHAFLPWLVCFSASLFLFYEFIQGNMFASIADSIMHDFAIKADKMAYLSSIYYLSNVLFLFIAGRLLDSYSAKKIILAAMLLCVLSTFVLAYTQSFWIALLCRFITGMGSAFCFVGPIRIASRWFNPRRMALVTGCIVTFAMLGGMLSQYPLTSLVVQVGWRNALWDVGVLGVLMLILMYVGVKEKETPKSLLPTSPKLPILLKKTYFNPQILRAATFTSLMNMAIAVFGAMMGTLYIEQRLGMTKEAASVVNTMLFLGSILGGPFFGWISDKLALRVWPMGIGCLLSLVSIVAILYAPVSFSLMKILFFSLGFFTAAQVISYALVAEKTELNLTATAVSVISILTQGGYVIYQNIFSVLLIKHGEMHMEQGVPVYSLNDYQFAAIILPIGLLIALLSLWGLRESHGHHVEE